MYFYISPNLTVPMGINKNSYQRHILLDKLLNSRKRWRSARELYLAMEEELRQESLPTVSYKQITRDLNDLREQHFAPLNFRCKSYPEDDPGFVGYTEKFSVRDLKIEEKDIKLLEDSLEIFRGLVDFKDVLDLQNCVNRLSNKIKGRGKDGPRVLFESHTQVDNLDYLSVIFNAVGRKVTLHVKYQPYGDEVRSYIVYPYLLREYRNRWFLIGGIPEFSRPMTFAIDRIRHIEKVVEPFVDNSIFDPATYFENLIGVAPPYDSEPQDILVKISPRSADYVLSKPIHKDQELVDELEDGSVIIKLKLYVNYELKQVLLGYGAAAEVLEPLALRKDLANEVRLLNERYAQSH